MVFSSVPDENIIIINVFECVLYYSEVYCIHLAVRGTDLNVINSIGDRDILVRKINRSMVIRTR